MLLTKRPEARYDKEPSHDADLCLRGQIQTASVEFKQQRHYGIKLMAYTMINLRQFCGA
jgi:hypothetical protein